MKRRPLVWLLALPVLLFASYQVALVVVREYVNTRITESHGEDLPAFSLSDRGGQTYTAADLAGKVGVLHFMRSRCHSCEAEKDEVRAFVAGLDAQEVVFLSVMMDEVMGFSPEETRRTLERSAFTHPVLMADEAFVDAFHGVGWAKVTPITYFVNREGRITTSLRGPQTGATLSAALRQARGA